ncbi:MAG: PAS domain S-box protein [Candidatus Acidiferrum sp.]
MDSLRILIADDHEAVRRGLRSLLAARSDWLLCGEAVDGTDAVEKTRALRPDAVLMDVSMPRMNGLEATRVIGRDLPECKVVIVSQNDPEITRRQAEEVNAAAFVAKSELVQSLFPTLDRLFERSPGGPGVAATPRPPASFQTAWLAGGGELGKLIREHDWAQTPLGPLAAWPQSLKTSVNLMLNSQQPMWIGWGPDITFLYNDAYISVLSLAKHPQSLGQPASKVWPEIWDICGPLADKVFRKGEATFVDDVRLFMNRGDFLEEVYFSFSYSPIHDESGKVGGLFCPNNDTTAKNLSARRLHTLSELAANALVERSPEAACASSFAALAQNPADLPFALLYLSDGDGNRAVLEQSTGIPKDVPSLSPAQVILDQKLPGSPIWRMNEVLGNCQAQVLPLTDLASVPLGPSQQPVREAIVLPVTSSGQNRPIGVFIAGVNPTRKLDVEYRAFFDLIAAQVATVIQNARAAEAERQRAEALAEIDRAKTTFFSNVSHEFRTPLTLMLAPVEDLLAKSHTNLSPSAKAQLELVNRNGARLLRLVNTLLDFSRLEAGRMQAVFQATDLAAFTRELASVFRSATEKAGLILELDCPTLSEPTYVDRDMWEKIVLNLISNAFKFTFEGKITVALETAGGDVELRVSDTGVGIPAHELPRLFDRFHRIENTRSRTHEGSGIGLALVQELVKLHGGSVRVQSTPGEGSTFFVRVPAGCAHLPSDSVGKTRSLDSTALGAAPFIEEALRWLPHESAGSPQDELPSGQELLPVPYVPDSGAAGGSEKRPHVLVADDNADMRLYLVRLLAERYDVRAVPDGQAALDAARERPPQLVLTDVMMPRLDGFALVRELRADPQTRTIPIILLSARAGEESRVKGLEKGADDYLIKPFSARELLTRVQTHLELARVREESALAVRASEQRLRHFAAIVDSSNDAIISKNLDGVITSWNKTAQLIFGYSAEEAVGQHISLIIPRDRLREEAMILERLKRGEQVDHFETVRVRKDGTLLDIALTISPVKDAEGRVVGASKVARDVTERKQAQEALGQKERRLRLATDAAGLGIWHWYPDVDIATWENDRPYEIFGRSREDGPISGAEFASKVSHPDDVAGFEQTFAHALKTGERLFYQGRIYRHDGSLAWVEFTGQPEYRADGSPLRVVGTVQDITPRKQAEQTLREHRERFELVAEAAQVGFWFCDLPFDKLLWDERVKEHFWLPLDADVTIDTFYERLHPADRERTRQAIDESIANGTPYEIEYRTISPDGQERCIRAIGRAFYHPAGKPVRFDGVTLDITASRRAELALGQANAEVIAATAKFQSVFEQTPVFAGIMTLDGTVTAANRLCLDACGYRAEEVVGRLFWECPWWRNSREVQAKIGAAAKQAAQGTPYREVLPYHFADGTERLVEFAIHPIRDQQGRILFLHPTGVDITDLKRAEENYRSLAESLDAEVRARTAELEQRNLEVLQQSEQLRELSHRLLRIQDEERRHIARELHDSAGQILTALGMNLARVAQQAQNTDNGLAKDTAQAQELVHHLSREIRTTSYLLHPPLLDESGLADALLWYIRGLQERSGLDITLDIPEDFGRLSHETELVIFRIVQESLTNVHRHSGSKVARIRISRDARNVALEIQDEGAGIPREKLLEIQSRGAGVGIRGMRERVLQCKGQMKIQSEGRGTTLLISLPIRSSGNGQAAKDAHGAAGSE